MATFEGISHNGSIEDAIQNAIANAMKSVMHTEPMVKWRLDSLSGVRLGIASLDYVFATIDADTGTKPK